MLMRVVALGVRKSMIGAIAGDIIGSRYEGSTSVPGDFELFGAGCMFTDDTVCTIAVADALLNGSPFAHNLRSFARLRIPAMPPRHTDLMPPGIPG